MKSSSVGLEKRKYSAKSSSAKTSPAREMAPFFSIFYRGITKINRSQSRADQLDREPGDQGDGGGGGRAAGQQRGGRGGGAAQQAETAAATGAMERSQSSRKFAEKPPLPKSMAADKIHRKSTSAANAGVTTSRSRSTIDLAKEKAAAQGKNWREGAPSSPELLRSSKKINSAPGSPQAQRRWPFGRFQKAQSQEPPLLPSPAEGQLQQNGHHSQPAPAKENNNKNSATNNRKNGFFFPGLGGHRSQQQPQPASPAAAAKPPIPGASASSPLTFAQRIRLHKGVRTGKIPVDALKLNHQQLAWAGSGAKTADKQKKGKKSAVPAAAAAGGGGGLYMSADAIHELSNDPDYIAEALRALGDEQPRVARSTPKHAYISQDPKRIYDRLRRDCLYPQDVYEKMVQDSLLVCDLLQTHLDDVISGVRAKSPTALSSPFTTPPGSPFMARSSSLHFPGANAPISRVTISVSPMAQQANPTSSPRPSGASLPPFPTSPGTHPPHLSLPLVRVTPASFRGTQFGSPRSDSKHLQFVS